MQTNGLEKARKYLHAHRGTFHDDNDEEIEERATLFERVGQFETALDDYERVVKLLLARKRPTGAPREGL
jgi:hypothetical protein